MVWFLNNKDIAHLIQVLNKSPAFRVPKKTKETQNYH